MTKDVAVAVVGAQLKEDVIGAVPLVEDLLDEIIALIDGKAQGSFVGASTGVAVNL
jgi:hypothetical protein